MARRFADSLTPGRHAYAEGRGIVIAGGDRILRTVGGPSCIAKNRYGMTDDLPLSWAAFMDAMSQQQQGVVAHG